MSALTARAYAVTVPQPVVFAIDPGPERSAFAVYNPLTKGLRSFAIAPNAELLAQLRSGVSVDVAAVVIEKVESFGMAVGAEVFETVFWSGRFAEAVHPVPVERLGRRAVKTAICHSARATDANIRAALLDRYGGRERAVGTKRAPGPLHGVAKDVWSALALAVAWSEGEER